MKPFNSLIDTSTRATVAQDRQIKKVFAQIVPATTLSHVQFCRLEGGRLRVTVDSAAWVARLRFTERQLIGSLKNNGLDIHTVSFHVSPAQIPVVRTTHRQPNRSSESAADLMQALADSEVSAGNSSENEMAGPADCDQSKTPVTDQYVITQDADRLRQELLKLAEKLRKT